MQKTLKWMLAGSCLALAPLMAAHADQLADIKAAGVMTMATDMQFVPFDFIQKNQHMGFDKDYFEEVGKAMGIEVKFLDLPWTGTLAGLEAKRFDLVAAPVIVTKERKTRYHFTLPIADATVAFLKRAKDTSVNKPEDVAGKVIGAQRGTSQLAQMKEFAATLDPAPEIREYVDVNQAYADLANGRLSAVANAVTNISAAARERLGTFEVVKPSFGKPAYYAFLGRLGADSDSLIKAIDDATLAMHKDGRMEALQEKWFGAKMDVPTADFTPAL